MALMNTLTELETGFWNASSQADGDFYRENSTEDARFVFFFGTLGREQCAEIIDGNTTPWAEFRFDDAQLVEPTADTAVLTYKAAGRHEGDNAEMVLFVSTVYALQGGQWRLVLHQQTPAQA